MPIFFTRGRITPPGHARPRSWEPRYAAQREASMAESLAYVAARTWPQGEVSLVAGESLGSTWIYDG